MNKKHFSLSKSEYKNFSKKKNLNKNLNIFHKYFNLQGFLFSFHMLEYWISHLEFNITHIFSSQ